MSPFFFDLEMQGILPLQIVVVMFYRRKCGGFHTGANLSGGHVYSRAVRSRAAETAAAAFTENTQTSGQRAGGGRDIVSRGLPGAGRERVSPARQRGGGKPG